MTTTSSSSTKVGLSQAVCQALDEAMAADDRVVLLGEDIGDEQGGGVFKATDGLSTKYPGRVRATPISEEAIVGAAIGAAIAGLRPVAEIMIMNFLPVAMDQICNHAAKMRYMSGGRTGVPLTIRTSSVGFVAGAQHSDSLESWFTHVPGLKVVAPCDPADAKGLLLACIADDDPCLFIESMLISSTSVVTQPAEALPLGKANVRRVGSDVTVIGYGAAMSKIESVASALGDEGVSVEIVDPRTLVPLDEDTILQSVAKTRRAVVVTDAIKAFGVGAEISSRIHEHLFGELHAPVGRVGAKYIPVPFSPALAFASQCSESDIDGAVRAVLG